jgi:CheY-like chemotaxis protein
MITGDTILLVEDNADDAALFAAAARKARPKATLLTISTGSEAVQYFEGRGKFTDRKRFSPPTMAFIDLALPDLPGEQLIKWIRNQPQFKRLLLAVLTGSADARQLRACS